MNRTSLIVIGALAFVCALSARADEPTRTLKADMPASGLRVVSLVAGVGEVRIEPSHDGAVHVAVTLKPKEHGMWVIKWHSGMDEIKKATLNKDIDDGVLRLSLSVPNADDDDDSDFKQEWHVRMPAALTLKSRVNVGEVRIDGIAGGVTARTKVGEMHIHVPKGSVKARVKVGELDVTTGATAYRDLTLDSSIGDVNIDGIDLPESARGQSGMGKHVSLKGHGTDDFDLSCEIGEVNLGFGEQP
ncbi:MAG TPA: hypothetical protein VFK24_01420 [Gammaproteobacteria bacterium]|nr:hypothetical protein [Gammaproteobacteria bacterium]